MSHEIHELLSKDDKGLSTARNVCAKLFRHVLYMLSVDRATWDKAMRNWMFNPKSGVADNVASRSSTRSSINRTISGDTITWRTMREGFQILGAKDVHYSIDLTWDPNIVHTTAPPDKINYQPRGQENELMRIFMRIAVLAEINPKSWSVLMSRYCIRKFSGRKNNPVEQSTFKGNTNKAIWQRDSYTWNTFVKALAICGVTEAKMTIEITWQNNHITEHTTTFKPV